MLLGEKRNCKNIQATSELSFESEYPTYPNIDISRNLLGGRDRKFYNRQLAEGERNNRHTQFGLNKEYPLIGKVTITEDAFED